MIRTLLLFLWLCGVCVPGFSQSYGVTLGFRFGNDPFKRTVGLTSQQRIFERVTLEEILQTDFRYNTTGHAMIRVHQPLLSRRLNIYAGAGLSAGVEQSEFVDPVTQQITTTVNNRTIGADAVAGVEVTLLRYNLSLDYKPNFNLTGREPWFLGQGGFSLRYALVTGMQQNRRRRQRERDKRREERRENRENSAFWQIFRKDDGDGNR